MAKRGVQVEVFTRQNETGGQGVVEVVDGYRVVHIDLGPDRSDLSRTISEFTDGVLTWAAENGAVYDVVHSHYWLSGWAGVVLAGPPRGAARHLVPHAGPGEERHAP